MKLRRPCDAVSPEIWAMPIGPCRFSAPIAPVMMLFSPFSDCTMTAPMRSTP